MVIRSERREPGRRRRPSKGGASDFDPMTRRKFYRATEETKVRKATNDKVEAYFRSIESEAMSERQAEKKHR